MFFQQTRETATRTSPVGAKLKLERSALVETVAVLTRNPYRGNINIRESIYRRRADMPVVRHYFSIYNSAGGTNVCTIQRGKSIGVNV